MSELILTPEEKAAKSYLDWSDEALGKAVKDLAVKMEDKTGMESINITSAALLIANSCASQNATDVEYRLEDVIHNKKHNGNWLISVQRIDLSRGKNEAQMRNDWFEDEKEDGVCMHCGEPSEDGSYVCDDCYNQYTPGMMADLEE